MNLQSFNSLFDIRHMTFFFDIYFASDSCVNSSLAVSRQEQAFFHQQKTGPILELVKQQ